MPCIELVPVPLYDRLAPYNHVVDNLPITGLITRIDLVNSQVDINTQILSDSIGTQGTLANRLNQSLNQDGTLQTVAIDNALHHISEHLDGNGYVRMLLYERQRLSFIADNATNLQVQVQTISNIQTFANTTMLIGPSDSIVWRVNGESVFADINFPTSVLHGHYYGIIPAPLNPINPDFKSYITSSVSTAYKAGSLRVYINGIRLNENGTVSVPMNLPGPAYYLSLSYNEDVDVNGIVTSGVFYLSQAIPASASIIIDFDVLY